jgi:hypothetical protein
MTWVAETDLPAIAAAQQFGTRIVRAIMDSVGEFKKNLVERRGRQNEKDEYQNNNLGLFVPTCLR